MYPARQSAANAITHYSKSRNTFQLTIKKAAIDPRKVEEYEKETWDVMDDEYHKRARGIISRLDTSINNSTVFNLLSEIVSSPRTFIYPVTGFEEIIEFPPHLTECPCPSDRAFNRFIVDRRNMLEANISENLPDDSTN